jgi:hypothetical protein
MEEKNFVTESETQALGDILNASSPVTEPAISAEPSTPTADIPQVIPETEMSMPIATPETPVKEELPSVIATEEIVTPEPKPAPAPRTQAQQPARKPRRPVLRYKNEVTLRGTIAKMVEAKNVTVVTMAVKATMTISNYPTVMFFGDSREQVSRFKEGDRVYVKATLQSYDEKKLRKGQSPELVVGMSMVSEAEAPSSAATVEDDLGLRPIENAYCHDENQIEIRGQILAIECNKNNNVTLTIRTVTGARMSIIKYPYYARNTNHFLKNIYVHQFVRAIGTVQTANIPVESMDDSQQVRAQMIETATSIRAAEPDRKLKTKKKQFYILYDVYAVN